MHFYLKCSSACLLFLVKAETWLLKKKKKKKNNNNKKVWRVGGGTITTGYFRAFIFPTALGSTQLHTSYASVGKVVEWLPIKLACTYSW